VLEQEEMELAKKIWGSVASSTHFFVSAKTYEQQRHMMKDCELLNYIELMLTFLLSSLVKNHLLHFFFHPKYII
jgi:hypothetical protein